VSGLPWNATGHVARPSAESRQAGTPERGHVARYANQEQQRIIDYLRIEKAILRKAKLGAGHPDTLLSMYNVACCQAVLVSNSANPGKQADRAMESLKKAIAAGYKNPDEINKESDFDALRDRDDFKKPVADLEKQTAKKKE
jgi:hypothetical protein